MTDIEAKALALVNEVLRETESTNEPYPISRDYMSALCRAIEQHEAFKKEVSDAVEAYLNPNNRIYSHSLNRFIIPKPKPDPLVEVFDAVWPGIDRTMVNAIRAALEARGLEIRSKNDE